MSTFTIHSIDSAPEASKTILTSAQKTFGFVPSLMRIMTESPPTLEAYTTLSGDRAWRGDEDAIQLHRPCGRYSD